MAFNKSKTDAKLGKEINEYLTELGVETPTIEGLQSVNNPETAIALIAENVRNTKTQV